MTIVGPFQLKYSIILILSYPILSYPILSYPILSYPVLLYSTLLYSTLPTNHRHHDRDPNCRCAPSETCDSHPPDRCPVGKTARSGYFPAGYLTQLLRWGLVTSPNTRNDPLLQAGSHGQTPAPTPSPRKNRWGESWVGSGSPFDVEGWTGGRGGERRQSHSIHGGHTGDGGREAEFFTHGIH